MKYLVPCMLVAAIYYFFALAGLAVAIPPGRSSIVWPAAGVALGAVYAYGWRTCFGVALGSFCANLWVAPNALHALAPAVGAALEALAGAWLIHKLITPPWIFSPGKLLAFFAICFAVAPINGIWGPWALGLEPLLVQVRTWTIGDAIGACLMAPAVVFLQHEAEDHERLKLTMHELMELQDDE